MTQKGEPGPITAQGRSRPHDGTITGDGFYYRDFGGYVLPYAGAVTVDHLVTASGTVMVEVNGRPLRRLPDHYPDTYGYDETGGVPAPGF